MLAAVAAGMGRLGIEPGVLESLEADGLVELSAGEVRFRDARAQATVYGEATAVERRAAHGALADVLDEPGSEDRRAWHLAKATVLPDERIAGELESASERARQWSGLATAAGLLERAARLSPSERERARRLFAAARLRSFEGDADAAPALLDEALGLAADPLLRAHIQLARGRTQKFVIPGPGVYAMLVREADAVEKIDRRTASLLLAEASIAGMTSDLGTGLFAAERAYRLGGRTPDPFVAMVYGHILALTRSGAKAERLLERGLADLHRAEPAEAADAAFRVGSIAYGSRTTGSRRA